VAATNGHAAAGTPPAGSVQSVTGRNRTLPTAIAEQRKAN